MTATETPEFDVEPFHIVFGENDQGPTMNIGVCVNDPLRELIMSEKIENPYLFVVIRQDGHDVQRQLVPLKAGFKHITFTKPGEYEAYTMVVYTSSKFSTSQMKRLLTEKNEHGDYKVNLFSGSADPTPFGSFHGSVGTGIDMMR